MHPDNLDELTEKRICDECVEDPYLSKIISKQGVREQCSYCNKENPTLTIGDVSDRVHTAFESHYVRTSPGPSSLDYAMMADRESTYTWEREGEPVVYAIMGAAGIPEEAAEDTPAHQGAEFVSFGLAEINAISYIHFESPSWRKSLG